MSLGQTVQTEPEACAYRGRAMPDQARRPHLTLFGGGGNICTRYIAAGLSSICECGTGARLHGGLALRGGDAQY